MTKIKLVKKKVKEKKTNEDYFFFKKNEYFSLFPWSSTDETVMATKKKTDFIEYFLMGCNPFDAIIRK